MKFNKSINKYNNSTILKDKTTDEKPERNRRRNIIYRPEKVSSAQESK